MTELQGWDQSSQATDPKGRDDANRDPVHCCPGVACCQYEAKLFLRLAAVWSSAPSRHPSRPPLRIRFALPHHRTLRAHLLAGQPPANGSIEDAHVAQVVLVSSV